MKRYGEPARLQTGCWGASVSLAGSPERFNGAHAHRRGAPSGSVSVMGLQTPAPLTEPANSEVA